MIEPLKFTDEQRRAYRAAYASDATDDQFTLFIGECERRALIPGVHVFFQLRASREYDKKLRQDVIVQKVTLITGINALRLIAERSGKFEGYGRFQFYYGDNDGKPTVKSDIPLGRIPHAVGVELYRAGWRNPVFAVARFDACAQFKADKSLNRMWATRGEEQLAKCAEAAGLRMVAPEECGGLYIEEEMGNQSEPETPAAPTPTVIPPQPTVAPVVNQAAAPAPAAPAPPATPAPAAQATPKPPVPAGPAPKSPPPPPPAARTAPAPPPAAPNPSPVPAAPVEPVAATAARVNAQADQAKAEFVAKVAEQQTDLTPAEKQEMKGAMERDPDPVPAATVTESVADAEAPATPTERQTYLNRAAKIVRDTMEGKAKVKEAGALLRSYFAKQAGVTDLKKITAAKWEQMISELEGIADPMAVAEKVKAGAK